MPNNETNQRETDTGRKSEMKKKTLKILFALAVVFVDFVFGHE